ncbi:hypothetical protein Q604_UNBc4C00039G0001, partial [human gut metagenome]
YDVMLIPRDSSKLGIIIEFKKIDDFMKKSIETGIQEALKQIEENKYEAELIDRGVGDILKLAIVFKGKKVKIVEGWETSYSLFKDTIIPSTNAWYTFSGSVPDTSK